MSELVRIAIVGWGRWGRVCHGLLASATPGCALHAVVSGDAEKRQKVEAEHRCRTYATPAEAFADDLVDLVVLATPNDAHADLACAALAAGKHVLVDKPLAPTLPECDRMIAAAQDAGRALCVFNNRRYDGDFRTARRLVADGRLGDLRWAEMAWQGGGPPGGWRGDATRGGGRFVDLGSHLIDQLLLLIPDTIAGVYCRLMREFEHKDVESDALLIVHFAGGATGVIDCSSRAAIPQAAVLPPRDGGDVREVRPGPAGGRPAGRHRRRPRRPPRPRRRRPPARDKRRQAVEPAGRRGGDRDAARRLARALRRPPRRGRERHAPARPRGRGPAGRGGVRRRVALGRDRSGRGGGRRVRSGAGKPPEERGTGFQPVSEPRPTPEAKTGWKPVPRRSGRFRPAAGTLRQ